MSNPTNTADAMAAFLAKGNQITQCGSSMKQARSLKAMRRDDEQGIVAGRRVEIDEDAAFDAECRAERMAESAAARSANGYAVNGFDSDGFAE